MHLCKPHAAFLSVLLVAKVVCLRASPGYWVFKDVRDPIFDFEQE